MAHARKQIREAIAAALVTPGVAVQESRQYPTNESEMPLYLVYTTDETVDESMSTSRGMMRTVTVMVEAIMMGDEATIDDDLDAHAVTIETALNTSVLGGLVLKTFLQRSELAIRTDGDLSLGVLTLTFAVLYRTLPTNPETIS
jgi:hypothetical protein